MLKAKATLTDGRPLYVMGLSSGKLQLLRKGKPIFFDAAIVHRLSCFSHRMRTTCPRHFRQIHAMWTLRLQTLRTFARVWRA
jgi:hypothetical protein